MIRESGIVAKLWRPEIEIIHFETRDGPLVKYVTRVELWPYAGSKRIAGGAANLMISLSIQ